MLESVTHLSIGQVQCAMSSALYVGGLGRTNYSVAVGRTAPSTPTVPSAAHVVVQFDTYSCFVVPRPTYAYRSWLIHAPLPLSLSPSPSGCLTTRTVSRCDFYSARMMRDSNLGANVRRQVGQCVVYCI